MSDLADAIGQRIAQRRLRVSRHAQRRLLERRIRIGDLLDSVAAWRVIEEYPDGRMGPSLLALHELPSGPVHAVWGMFRPDAQSAVLVTVYLPDKEKWDGDFRSRRKT